MADANARRAMIKQATFQVRNGGAFIRRATAARKTSASAKVATPKSPARPSDKGS
jgi:hypothetical protein